MLCGSQSSSAQQSFRGRETEVRRAGVRLRLTARLYPRHGRDFANFRRIEPRVVEFVTYLARRNTSDHSSDRHTLHSRLRHKFRALDELILARRPVL